MRNSSNHYLPVDTVLAGQDYQYKIQKVLGEGTFGITYLAKAKISVGGKLGNLYTEIDVAVKEFFMKDFNERNGTEISSGNHSSLFTDYREKFRKEALNLSRMKHKGIVKVIEAFDANNTSYYVMEYIPGGSLDDEIKQKGKLDIERVKELVPLICDILSYMHKKNMLHLDLKPQNIMINGRGEPILIDFGLSKAFDKDGNPETTTLIGGGTDGYAPLEQSTFDNNGQFTATLDIYALGGTLFKMLTGKQPPTAVRILNDQYILEKNLCKVDVSQNMIRFIERAMSPLQNGRIQNMDDFLNKFRESLGNDEEQDEYTFAPNVKYDSTEDNESENILEIESSSKEKDAISPFEQDNSEKNNYKYIYIIRRFKFYILSIAIILACILLVVNKWDGIEVNEFQEMSLTEKDEDIHLKVHAPLQVNTLEHFDVLFTVNTTDVENFKAPKFSGMTILKGPDETRYTDSVQYTYVLTAQKEGTYEIPTASIIVHDKEYTSNKANITVIPLETKAEKSTSTPKIQFSGKAKKQVGVREQFILSYTVNSNSPTNFNAGAKVDPFDAFFEDKETLYLKDFVTLMGPTRYTKDNLTTYTYTLISEKSGRYKIPSATIEVNGKEYRSNEIEIEVLPVDETFITMAPAQVKFDEPFKIDFVVNSLNNKDFKWEGNNYLSILKGPSKSENGNIAIYSYDVKATDLGKLKIPRASVTINNKVFSSNNMDIDVVLQEQDNSQSGSGNGITFVTRAPAKLKVGKQFRLSFTVNALKVRNFIAPSFEGFEVLMGPSKSSKQLDSSNWTVTFTYILMANKIGTFNLPGARITVDGQSYNSNGVTINVNP